MIWTTVVQRHYKCREPDFEELSWLIVQYKTMDSIVRSLVQIHWQRAMVVVPLGKALNPHCLVPLKGLKANVPWLL